MGGDDAKQHHAIHLIVSSSIAISLVSIRWAPQLSSFPMPSS